MSTTITNQINAHRVFSFEGYEPDNLAIKPELDRGVFNMTATLDLDPSSDVEGIVTRILPETTGTTTESRRLYRQIATFIDHPSTSYLTQKKIQERFKTFTNRIQELEAEEGHNAILIAAEGLIESNQRWITENGQLTLLRKTPSPSDVPDSPRSPSSSSSSSSSSFSTMSGLKQMFISILPTSVSSSSASSFTMSSLTEKWTSFFPTRSRSPLPSSQSLDSSSHSSSSSSSSSSITSAMTTEEESAPQKPLTEEDKLYYEISTFFQTPQADSLPPDQMEDHLKGFDESLKALEASSNYPSFRIRLLLENRKLLLSSRSSTLAPTSSTKDTSTGQKFFTEEEKLYAEIITFFEDPKIYSMPLDQMEKHLNDFDGRLKRMEASSNYSSYRIRSFLEERRKSMSTQITSSKSSQSASSSSSSSTIAPIRSTKTTEPSLLDIAREMDAMARDIAGNKISLKKVSERLANFTKQIPLQIGKEQIQMPVGALVLYHLTMMHSEKSPSNPQINDPEYGIKAFENRDGCTATNQERVKALYRARDALMH